MIICKRFGRRLTIQEAARVSVRFFDPGRHGKLDTRDPDETPAMALCNRHLVHRGQNKA